VYVNPRPDGTMWCFGDGLVRGSPNDVTTTMESERYSKVLDKQLLKTDVLRELPLSALSQANRLPEGWTPAEFRLRQSASPHHAPNGPSSAYRPFRACIPHAPSPFMHSPCL
jgi:hypothetical protein